jgi:hypothetical protein
VEQQSPLMGHLLDVCAQMTMKQTALPLDIELRIRQRTREIWAGFVPLNFDGEQWRPRFANGDD